MNTATGLVSTTPLQVALQVSPDQAVPAVGGDFTAALAAACVAEPESGLPEGMQSAAALAWLAGFVGAKVVAGPQQAAIAVNDSATAPVVDAEVSPELVPDAALSVLQGMLATVVPANPREVKVEPDMAVPEAVVEVAAAEALIAASMVQPAATDPVSATESDTAPVDEPVEESVAAPAAMAVATPAAQSAAATVALLATTAATAPARAPAAVSVEETADATIDAEFSPAAAVATGSPVTNTTHRAAPLTSPFALMKAMAADAQPDPAAALTSAAPATAGVSFETRAGNDAPADSNMGERLINALADRTSMRSDVSGTVVDGDRSGVTGPGLYASTREVVASSAGQVSTRPEVVHATVGSPRWANELGSRLAMMTVRGQQEGSLTLTPEHLGPLEVRISVNADTTTNVWFGAQHADTRAALADALPRLREMFAASGLALGQAGVSQDMPGREPSRSEPTGSRLAAEPEAPQTAPVARSRVTSGLLDTWA